MPEAMGVILVYATSHAMRAEKLLRQAKIPCRLVPVPRHLSSDCGVCVRIQGDLLTAAYELVSEAGVGVQGVHRL